MVKLVKFLFIYISAITLIISFYPNEEETTNNETINEIIATEIESQIDEVIENSHSPIIETPIIEEIALVKMDLLILSGHANMELDPGAVSQGRYEYAYAKDFTDLLANHIRNKYPQINVILEDAPYKAAGEATYINQIQPDYVISIHFNAGGGTGFEIITPLGNKNLTVATDIISNLKAENLPVRPLAIYSRSATTNRIERTVGKSLSGSDYYAVINMGSRLNIISEIFELEFIDNAQAMQEYEVNKTKYVNIIAKAINEYWNVEFKN